MDLFLFLFLLASVIGAILAFDVLAMAVGTDSRPTIGDDHAWTGRL